MALITTISGATSDAYDTLANGLIYYSIRGYCGTFWTGSPLVDGIVAAAAVAMAIDGGTGTESILTGDQFLVSAVAGKYSATQRADAVAGAIASITFSPAAPTGGFGDDAPITSLALTDEMVRRGVAELDERFRMRLQGIQTTSGQALAWPRHGVVDEDGNGVDSATIPQAVIDASFEMGRITSLEMVVTGAQRIRSAGAGSARVEFASGFQVDTTLSYVDRLMAPYLKSGNRLVRA